MKTLSPNLTEVARPVVLGVDPGTIIAGYSVVTGHGSTLSIKAAGVCKLSAKKEMPVRVHEFFVFFNNLIITHGVTCIALETPFVGKNAQTALKLGYVRGVLYLLAQMHTINLYELAPSQIKRAITGSGSADKEQVARVIHRLFPTLGAVSHLDITDAIAIGICGAWDAGAQRAQTVPRSLTPL